MTAHQAETRAAVPLEHPPESSGRSAVGSSRWTARRDRFQREIFVIWFLLRQPKTPWYVRTIAGLVAAYVVSPIQLIPSFIPVIGLMDDVFVAAVGLAMIRWLAPPHVLEEARERARIALAHGENVLPTAWRKTTMIVAACWLVVSFCVFLILYRW